MLKFFLELTFVMAMLVFTQHQASAVPHSMLDSEQISGVHVEVSQLHHMMPGKTEANHNAEHKCKDMQEKCCQNHFSSNCISHCAAGVSACLLFTMTYTQPGFTVNSKVLHHSWASTPATLSSKNPPPIFQS